MHFDRLVLHGKIQTRFLDSQAFPKRRVIIRSIESTQNVETIFPRSSRFQVYRKTDKVAQVGHTVTPGVLYRNRARQSHKSN